MLGTISGSKEMSLETIAALEDHKILSYVNRCKYFTYMRYYWTMVSGNWVGFAGEYGAILALIPFS